MPDYKIRYTAKPEDGFEETRRTEVTAADRNAAIAQIRESDPQFMVVNTLVLADAPAEEKPSKSKGQILFLIMSALMALAFIGSGMMR
jgi:hypothetical protein